MKSRPVTISGFVILTAIMIVSQSCDSRLTIEEPKRFYKLIGTDGDQFGVDLVEDSDNNLYVLGTSTTTTKGRQLYVVKTNSKGIVLWEQMLGDSGDEDAKDIEITRNGDLVIAGDRTDPSGEADFVIYRVRATDGTVIGTPTIGGYPGIADFVNSITETSDGFVVASYSDNGDFKEANLFRYDANMALFPSSWLVNVKQVFPTGGFDVIPVKVVQLDDDLFYTFGYTNTTLNGDLIPDYNFFIYVSNGFNDYRNAIIIPGPGPNTNEVLTTAIAAPVVSGGGFVLGGYISDPASNAQEFYMLQVVQSLEGIQPSETDKYLIGSPRTVTSQLSSITTARASVFASKTQGFIVLASQNTAGNDNIYLKKVNNQFADAWPEPHTDYSFGGDGNDLPGAVIETSDGRIILCGTMVLGNAIGQKKVVLINVNPFGKFDE